MAGALQKEHAPSRSQWNRRAEIQHDERAQCQTIVQNQCGEHLELIGGALWSGAASSLPPCFLFPLLCCEIVANDHSALHHELDGFKNTHVGNRITADSDQIGIAT